MLVDTHCHLDAAEFDADRDAVCDAALAAGVGLIVVPAVEAGNFGTVAALHQRQPRCAYALGIHPMYTDRAQPGDLDQLREHLERAIDDPWLVAIGEIGLDFFVPGLDRERQVFYFTAQLNLAREFGLPVLLHVRRSQDEVLARLRRFRPPGGIAHAFNGSVQQAMAYVDLGFALGFGGAFTYGRALRIRRLVSDLPDHAHVLETDAPDIAPEWVDGRNSPAELPRIARTFAQVRGVDPAQAIAQTCRNVFRVLPRLESLARGL